MKNVLSQDAIFLAPGGGATLACQGAKIAYKVSSTETDSAWALLEITLPPHFAETRQHWHKSTSVGLYVIDGQVTFHVAAQIFVAGPGAFLHMPAMTPYSFSNRQEQDARMLEIIVPGGFENYFKEVVALTQVGETGLQSDSRSLKELSERHDVFIRDDKKES